MSFLNIISEFMYRVTYLTKYVTSLFKEDIIIIIYYYYYYSL